MPESEEEQEARYRGLFESMDRNHAGKINLKEFSKTFEASNHPLQDKKAIGEVFQSFDLNNDNYIDFQDFKRYVTVAEQQIRRGFSLVDADHDGKLSKADLIRYFEETLHLKPTARDIDVFFSNVDNKNDGIITYDEFRDFLLFFPRLNGSRIKTAFQLFNNDKLDYTNSEGDVTVIDDFLKGFGYFMSGGLSGVVSRTCTAPFDRVKVFLIARTDLHVTFIHTKNDNKAVKLKSPIVKAATSLYRQGGVRAFYVGNGLNVLKVFPESAMKFGSFELAKRFFCQLEGTADAQDLSKLSTYISGGFGGVVSQMAVYPIDTLKYRLQCAQLDSNLKGTPLLVSTARQMYKEGGIAIFYRGLIAGITGIFPYAALDLGTFSTIKKWYLHREATRQGLNIDDEDLKLPNHIVLGIGAASGTFGASMVYPINLIRTRLQAQGTFAHPHVYKGFFDCARLTVAREGYSGLYKGLTPNLLKVAPAVSISYLCYENLKDLIGLD